MFKLISVAGFRLLSGKFCEVRITALRFFCYLLTAFFLPLAPASAEWHERHQPIMGTRVSVEFWHDNADQADQLAAAVFSDMRSIEAQLSPYIESSELSTVNQQAHQSSVVIEQNFFQLLEKSLYFSRISDGAFDISFASVGRFYDYRKEVAPSDVQLEENLPAINYQLIQLNKEKSSIRFLHPQLKIDLGGIAKGYAVDRAVDLLKEAGVQSAIVSAGGDSRILGDRQGTPWMIGVRHPREEGEYVVRIPLSNTAISTSGDYERFYLDGETRIHHILDPKSGKSASEVQSVSVMSNMAVDTDALSTTVFVMGVSPGLKLINSLSGVDAIIIDGDGKLHYSDGLLRAESQ